ncbi:MAG TPA: hypothetical protein VMR21_12455 [Vicinamibacteria bacterium]|nr:hypothetical protein [Vicinamibacteria bacterium]
MTFLARAAVALAPLLGAVPGSAGAADLTIVWTVTTPRGGERTQTHSITSTKIRTTDADRDVIVDAASGRVVFVDHRRKEHSESSLEDVAAFLRQMDAALAGGTAVERTLGPLGPVRVEKGGESRTIAGFATERYTLSMGDSIRFEVWAALSLPAPAQVYDARRVVFARRGPIGTRFDRILEEMREIPGMPLAVTIEYRMRMGPRQVTTEAREVRQGPIPESTFAVPAGYEKVEPPFGRQRR